MARETDLVSLVFLYRKEHIKTQKVKSIFFTSDILYLRSTSMNKKIINIIGKEEPMNNLEILTKGFEYIEEHLQEELKTQDVADACYCSKSALEKIFRCLSHMSVHEYVLKRRMTIAARLIVSEPDTNLLDVALALGYSTNESFSRAFKSVWFCNPSEFRNRKRAYELFPRLHFPIEDGGTYMRRNVDISELYDLFVERKNCYFVCCDIKSLIPINNISYKAGDIAILESMNRMEKEAGDEDIVFRIGGDEFVMLTASEDIVYANDVCDRIRAYNGNPIVFEGTEIPLTLYVTPVKWECGSNIRYNELFDKLHNAIIHNK